MSFSASVGWNEQVSEVTIQLVEDNCDGAKKYFNSTLSKTNFSTADPGFFGLTTPIIGSPTYFRVGDFEFSGLVQSWEETHAQSGNPTYQVKLVDPRAILENSQIIINEYAGGVGSLYNIINAYGYMETFGIGCPQYYQVVPGLYVPGDGAPDGAVFGSPAEAFGGANVNDNGMQWNKILSAQRILLGSFPRTVNIFSPYGRLAFKAPSSFPATNMGIMGADVGGLAYYFLDLNEVPNAPSYWRLNGANVSILDGISQICQDAGCDYFIELIPIVGGVLGPGIHKFIKVRTADRFSSPALNSIDAYIGASGREVISYNKGRELRNELTQAFVIGGPKNSFYQAEQSDDPEGDGQPDPEEKDDMIIPFFGLNPNNENVFIPERDDDGFWVFEAHTVDLAMQLATPKYNRAIQATLFINERELMAASSGFDAWMSWASMYNSDLWEALSLEIKGVFNMEQVIEIVKQLQIGGNEMRAADFPAIRKGAFKRHDDNANDFEVAEVGFAWIKKFVDEYYGKQYQVRVPFTCGRKDGESGQILISEQPNDGGWTEVTPVLQLEHPSIFTDFLTLGDNRLGAFSRFDNIKGLELSNLDVNQFVTTNNKAWIKLGVKEEYVYVDKNTLFSPRAIVTLPQTIRQIEDTEHLQQAWAGLVLLLTNFAKKGGAGGVVGDPKAAARIKQVQHKMGAVQTHLNMANRAEMPDAVAFGIKSNVLTYGPWGAIGAVGGVQVTHDEGLVPWEYGGFTVLNLAGNATANEGITNQQVAEEGQVTVAGYPDVPLGAELLSADAGGPFSGGGNNLVENRNAVAGVTNGITYYGATIGSMNGAFGPNITGITTQVGPDGLQTTYNLKTWTPKFGRFQKGNAARLKQMGRNRLMANKQLRAFALHRIKQAHIALLDQLAGERKGIILDKGFWAEAKTPHEILGGQIIDWHAGAYDRPLVATMSTVESPVELAEEYEEKAFMSLDGLLRPVSMDYSGALPPYAKKTSNCQITHNRGAQPPIDKAGEAGNLDQYNLDIDIDYLNPFSNPSRIGVRAELPTNRTDTPDHGHDIEFIARGTGLDSELPDNSMMMPIEGWHIAEDTKDSDHSRDYRMMALRGPLLMQGWGYDLDGFPIPNKVDNVPDAEMGIFEDENLECKFIDNVLRKSRTWPVGPVDLRWDRARAVWTIPQYRCVVAKLECDICPKGSGLASQTSGPDLYDCNGNIISNPQFIAVDYVGHECLKSGDCIIAKFDPYECTYCIIEHKSRREDDDLFRFRLLECVCIDFVHRAGRYAKGMREKWNLATEAWEDDYEIKLYPGCGGVSIGPAQSGCCGWAKVLSGPSVSNYPDCTGGYCEGGPPAQQCCPEGTGYEDFVSPTDSTGGGAQVIWLEEMANWIEFETIQNPGCIDDLCFSAAVRANGAEATWNDTWNGKPPQGIIAVVWKDSEDITCIKGYLDCMGPLQKRKGIAVLDKEESSAAICSPGCYDEEICGYWVYNIVEWDKDPTITDICCTGNIAENKECIKFRTIELGTGLTFTQPNDWDVRIQSNMGIIDTDCCLIPKSGFARMVGCKPFEKINFGAGLWVHKASDSGEDCGIVFDDPACENIECLLHVFAGFRPINNSGLCFKDDGSKILCSTGDRFINVVDFQGGMRAVDGPNDCDLLIRTGIEVATRTGCVTGIVGAVDPDRINHKIEFMDGIQVRDDDQDDCTIQIGAGMRVLTHTGCFGNEGPGKGFGDASENGHGDWGFINRFKFGKGFRANRTTGLDCEVSIQAGILLDTQEVCVTGTPDNSCLVSKLKAGDGIKFENQEPGCVGLIGSYVKMTTATTSCAEGNEEVPCANKITIGQGLGLEKINGSDCEALLSVYMDFCGVKASKISCSSCFTVIDLPDCVADLQLTDHLDTANTGTLLSGTEYTVLTGISGICCPNGSGLRGIAATTQIFTFNFCGQLIATAPGATVSGSCPCP